MIVLTVQMACAVLVQIFYVGITLVYYLVLSGQPDVLQKILVGNSEGNNALQDV